MDFLLIFCTKFLEILLHDFAWINFAKFTEFLLNLVTFFLIVNIRNLNINRVAKFVLTDVTFFFSSFNLNLKIKAILKRGKIIFPIRLLIAKKVFRYHITFRKYLNLQFSPYLRTFLEFLMDITNYHILSFPLVDNRFPARL